VVTGQQRFALEIANRLPGLLPDLTELRASVRAEPSRTRQWIELQMKVPRRIGDGLLISLTARTPMRVARQIVTIHDLFPLTHPEWYSRKYRPVHRRLLLHHLKHADGIVVVSKPVRDAVVALVSPGTPVVVAPNAPSAALVAPDLNRAPAASYFLAVGSLEPRKNLGRLISAYGLLNAKVRADTSLLIAGGSAGIYGRTDVGGAEIPDGVKFLGRVTDSELAALYHGATAFVSVSLDEGFGLPLVEAAQITNGVMVVSDIPTYRWVMGSTPALYVDPTAIESIANGLTAALTATADIDALRALAHRFNWDSSAQAVADLARAVCPR
jgi:glycosyltransferase involved in cell wall biosynthesis